MELHDFSHAKEGGMNASGYRRLGSTVALLLVVGIGSCGYGAYLFEANSTVAAVTIAEPGGGFSNFT